MTPEEEQQLRAMSADLAAAETSPWQPACVCRAFAAPGEGQLVLTMQGWIDLEAVRSPLLAGEPLTDDAQFVVAAAAFDLDGEALDGEEALRIERLMREAIGEAFDMALPMQLPRLGPALPTTSEPPDGFGSWLPLRAALIGQLHIAPHIAMAYPVGQAFADLAAHRRNEGWSVAGKTYAQRDMGIAPNANGQGDPINNQPSTLNPAP